MVCSEGESGAEKCGSNPANRRLVQQRFALLRGPGACGLYNCNKQKKNCRVCAGVLARGARAVPRPLGRAALLLLATLAQH